MTYTGEVYLDQVMAALSRHLRYHWQFILSHRYRQPIYDRRIYTHYKSILCFTKGKARLKSWIDDVLHGTGKEKGLHDWQQNVTESIHFIGRLTVPGNLIIDPFGGSFTTAEAVLRVGDRRFIGCDVDPACVVRGQERVKRVREELAHVQRVGYA
jgi:DNA modification methylase